jgi:hypothetical protein
MQGGWDRDVMITSYMTGLPFGLMRLLAGFQRDPSTYFLRRDGYEPPALLLLQIWPWVEAWEARFNARHSAKKATWEQGGLGDDDFGGKSFLRLLKHLRRVLLQDLAVLQPKFPKMRLFGHRLFEMPEWAEFVAIVQAAEAAHAEEPQSVLLSRALPEISNSLHRTRDAVLLSLSTHQAFVKHELATVRANMRHLHNNMSRQAFTMVSTIRSSIQVSPLTIFH